MIQVGIIFLCGAGRSSEHILKYIQYSKQSSPAMASQPHTTTRQQSGPSSTRMILHFLFGKAINLLHPASSIAALYNAENTRNDN